MIDTAMIPRKMTKRQARARRAEILQHVGELIASAMPRARFYDRVRARLEHHGKSVQTLARGTKRVFNHPCATDGATFEWRGALYCTKGIVVVNKLKTILEPDWTIGRMVEYAVIALAELFIWSSASRCHTGIAMVPEVQHRVGAYDGSVVVCLMAAARAEPEDELPLCLN